MLTCLRTLPVWLLLVACQAEGAGRAQTAPFDPPRPAAFDGETPYTAAEIQSSCSDGTELVFRVEQQGAPSATLVMSFDQADASGTLVYSRVIDAGGVTVQESSARSTWEELRSHAAFPAQGTTQRRTRCAVEAGEFDCRLYEVVSEDGNVTDRFWFADDRAGPPILMEKTLGGTPVYRMELIERRDGPGRE